MILFIKYRSNRNLPDIADLVKIMWKDNVNFSKVANAVHFKKCTTLTLSWDKWLDHKRWSTLSKAKEYIYFDLVKEPRPPYKMKIEIADDAIEVDKCAFYKAAIYIGEKVQGKISTDEISWIDIQSFAKAVDEYLKLTFEDAVELSLSKQK